MFDALSLLPADPILGLSQAYALDSNPNKVDLGVGVYKNDAGQTPIMKAVALAQDVRIQTETTKSYTPPACLAKRILHLPMTVCAWCKHRAAVGRYALPRN